ncbi:hypothetical protein FLX27_22045 [Agrobacterium tumefaciens]|nr:hypothetical protein [Agrobacterium tumefaciens]TQN59597.1 hypothetical protein FLX27_22045 [Agrobacterium tumefaciens]
MSVVVSFFKPGGIGGVGAAPGIGYCRATEVLAVPGTTTTASQAGEMILIVSSESNVVRVAHGNTPDAAAAAATSDTTAGYPVAPGIMVPVAPGIGHKINVKALA